MAFQSRPVFSEWFLDSTIFLILFNLKAMNQLNIHCAQKSSNILHHSTTIIRKR